MNGVKVKPKIAVNVHLYANDWVKIVFPKTPTDDFQLMPKDHWLTAWTQLKYLWGVSQLPSKHPYGYWMIHPNWRTYRRTIETLVDDINRVLDRYGYEAHIIGPFIEPERWMEAGALS